MAKQISLAENTDNNEFDSWADEKLNEFIHNYEVKKNPQRVSFRDLCKNWNWAKRSDVYTHYMHRYPAKLIPYIPIFFLSTSLANNDDLVLDSFGGTGTVALESITHISKPRTCKLVEINPLARLIASAKTTPITPDILEEKFAKIWKSLKRNDFDLDVPDFPGVDFWFRKKAKEGLTKVRECIEELDADVQIKDFFWASFSSIIRDMSRADPKIAPPVRLSKRQYETRKKEIDKKRMFKAETLFRKSVRKNIQRMRELYDTLEKFESDAETKIIGDDARKLIEANYIGKGSLNKTDIKALEDNSIGIVITSPPYINAQKYIRTTKLELWWLKLIDETSEALGNLDKELIGTEKVLYERYKEIIFTGFPDIDKEIKRIYKIQPKRAGIVSEYFIDMKLAIGEMYRVIKPGGYCILIVGNNLIFNKVNPNHKLLSQLSEAAGFITKIVLVDEIRSRGMITKRHETAGMIADEWVLVFQKPSDR